MIGGLALRYEIGGGTYGDVMEVDVMFTKVGTIKDEVVQVPNSQVLNNEIVNYSALERVIVHYQVTIGYDISHKRECQSIEPSGA